MSDKECPFPCATWHKWHLDNPDHDGPPWHPRGCKPCDESRSRYYAKVPASDLYSNDWHKEYGE